MEYTTTQNSNWQFNPLSLYITTFIIDVQNCKLIISCTTLSFSLSQKTHLLIQFLSKSQRQTITYSILFTANTQKIWYSDSIATRARSRAGHCVCLCRRERERERNGESKDAITVSLFWISGSLPRDRIATVHCSSLGVGLRDQTLQTVHMDVCSS